MHHYETFSASHPTEAAAAWSWIHDVAGVLVRVGARVKHFEPPLSPSASM